MGGKSTDIKAIEELKKLLKYPLRLKYKNPTREDWYGLEPGDKVNKYKKKMLSVMIIKISPETLYPEEAKYQAWIESWGEPLWHFEWLNNSWRFTGRI